MTVETKITAFLLSAILSSAGINESGTLTAGVNFPDDTHPDKWMLFPSVRLGLDPIYIFNNDSDLSGFLNSTVEIDCLQYRYFITSFRVDQMLEFSDVKSKEFSFHKIYYDIEFFNLRREFSPGSLSFFIDHRCSNYINIDAAMEMRTRWYGTGIRWETHGMTTGEKSKKKGVRLFSSDNYINYSLAARKQIHTEYYPADWTADFSITYDCYPYNSISAYISGTAEYFDSEEYSWNRSVEGGLRISAGPTEITPYLKYEYVTDNSGGNQGDKKFLSTGLRAESVLYSTEESARIKKDTQSDSAFCPEIHFNGSYGYFCRDDKKNFRTEGLFTLGLLKYGSSSMFINALLTHSSPKEQLGMYPAYIESYYEGGLSFNIARRIFIEPFYRYSGYDEGNNINTGAWSYKLAAARIRTLGMKPGFTDSGIIRNNIEGFKIISNFEAEISGGYVTEKDGIDTDWVTESFFRWDIFGYNRNVLYLMIGEKNKAGEDFSWTFITECGIWTGSGLLAMIFYRNEFNNKENPSRDISKNYHLIGVKFDF